MPRTRLCEEVLLKLRLLAALVGEEILLPLTKQQVQLLALSAHLLLDLICMRCVLFAEQIVVMCLDCVWYLIIVFLWLWLCASAS